MLTRTSNIEPLVWHKPSIYLLLPLLGISSILFSGCEGLKPVSPLPKTTIQTAATVLENSKDGSSLPRETMTQGLDFIVTIVKKVDPAVVQINTSQTVSFQEPEGLSDRLLGRFFGDMQPTQSLNQTIQGIGSGFVINSKGLILTNAHVVNKADTVTVALFDGRTLKGKVIGQDPVSDIAVVQVPANHLQTVTLGHSFQVQPGQWAIAIGNPFGLQETVTHGVISATSRSSSDIGVRDKHIDFLQTDAAINPGNSGGPLLNEHGEVIGINTAIIQGAKGLGFAIPIDAAMQIAQQLITKGKVEHPYLGMEIATLTPLLKQKLSKSTNQGTLAKAAHGVLIIHIVQGSPAAQAGLRPGDVIQALNNQPVNQASEFQQGVEKNGVGKPLSILLQRGERRLNVTVQPSPLPPQAQ